MSKSSTLAVALAGLAVVIAATGTAVAVTATQVNITDPTTPAHVARVDASGRLNVISPTAAYAYSSLLNVGGTDTSSRRRRKPPWASRTSRCRTHSRSPA